ncbi:MAG: TIGR04282 family arsenosugar biosynthesis glycosyltransferase [Gammaproteobacteria bacterium]
MSKSGTVILIFARTPLQGQVKTRLQPVFSEQECLSIYQRLLRRSLITATAAGQAALQLWVMPDIKHPFIKELGDTFDVSLHLQQGVDLGERMLHAATDALQHYQRAIIIGCDCPQLQAADLANAATRLEDGHDVVLGPASDGGYYLLALKAAHPTLFHNIAWGTETVLETTRTRLRQAQLSCYELQQKDDLDHPDDYRRDQHLLD